MLKKLARDWHVPEDFSRQTSSFSMAGHLAGRMTGIYKILDLGCGTGTSAEFFKKMVPDAQWIGLDISIVTPSKWLAERAKKAACSKVGVLR